ncbi:MAG: High-affinity branched-chain amino acid transport system permease protein LivH, partial [uncultured Frankineae bacterium]
AAVPEPHADRHRPRRRLRGVRPDPRADLPRHADHQLRAGRHGDVQHLPRTADHPGRLLVLDRAGGRPGLRFPHRRRRGADRHPPGRDRPRAQRGHRHPRGLRQLHRARVDPVRQHAGVVPGAVLVVGVRGRGRQHRGHPQRPLPAGRRAAGHGPAGRAVPLHDPRPADACRRLRAGGGPAARRAGRLDAHARLGAGRPVRCALRDAHRRRRSGLAQLHGRRHRLRLRRRGPRRAGQLRRRGGGRHRPRPHQHLRHGLHRLLARDAGRAGHPARRAAAQAGRPVLQLRRAEGL